MFACTDQNSPSNNRVAKDGLLPGKFSVSPAQQVQFSQGNLQYQESTNTWRFAERQYDVFGSNNNVAIKSDGWIDMFGWGTGSNPTALENYDFVDWGVNIISNGGKKARSWRTLTIKEWDYLLNGRSNADRLRGFGFVNNVYGMILFPDNWKMWVAFGVASITGACFDAAAAENSRELLEKRNFGVMKVMVPSKLMAVVIVMGVMMLLAGNMEVVSRNIEESWTLAFKVATAIVLVIALLLWATVGKMSETGRNVSVVEAWQQRKKAMADWWKADRRWLFALFVLFFPLHEFFLWRGTLLFLVDKGSIGGLSFSPQEMGFAFCTVATIIAMAGYVMGVECVRKNGLRKWWLVMALAFTVPDAIYVFLAYTMPGELWLVTACLSVEQWCCGFGIVAFLLYIMYGNGEVCEKVHLDMCWSLVIASIIISGCFTGVMQDYLGYRRFFIAVMAMAIIALCIAGWMAIRRKEQ